MIPSRLQGTTCLLLLLLSAPAVATSLAALNPLESITRVNVEVFVGDSIGGAHETRLFTGMQTHESRFKEAVVLDLIDVLAPAGIIVDQESEDFLGIGVWGHEAETTTGEVVSVYLVEITIVDADFFELQGCEDECNLRQEARAVGIAPPSELGNVLRAEVLRLVREQLPRRAR